MIHKIIHALDLQSWGLLGITFVAFTWTSVTIGVLAGLSTLIYNGIKIYKELKNKE